MQVSGRIPPQHLARTSYPRPRLNPLSRANLVRSRTLTTKIGQAALKARHDTERFLTAKDVQRKWENTEVQLAINRSSGVSIEKSKLEIDAGLIFWHSDSVKPIVWQAGSIKLLNSDKQDLIDTFIEEVESGQILLRDKVALICEGCDNGDYLAPLVAYFNSKKIYNVKIYLSNGVEHKVAAAKGFASCLIDKDNVKAFLTNAYKEIPEIEEYKGYQKIFCPFRLPIIQRERQIIRFLHRRLRLMQKEDLGLICFLIKNSQSSSLALNTYKYEIGQLNENRIIYRRKLPPLLEQELKNKNENILLEDTYLYITAFSEERLKLIFEKLNAELVVSKIVATTSDQGTSIKNMVALFRKNELSSS